VTAYESHNSDCTQGAPLVAKGDRFGPFPATELSPGPSLRQYLPLPHIRLSASLLQQLSPQPHGKKGRFLAPPGAVLHGNRAYGSMWGYFAMA